MLGKCKYRLAINNPAQTNVCIGPSNEVSHHPIRQMNIVCIVTQPLNRQEYATILFTRWYNG